MLQNASFMSDKNSYRNTPLQVASVIMEMHRLLLFQIAFSIFSTSIL